MKYLIFLRGINVGGNKKVPMKILEEYLRKYGYLNVKTHNNTGNVYVNLKDKNENLKNDIENILSQQFGFEIQAVVREYDAVLKIVEENVFEGIYLGKNLSANVSFLDKPSLHKFSEEQVIKQTETEIFWLHKKGGHDSPFEKNFEKKIGGLVTTRTWGTVAKCVEMGR